MVAAVRLPPAGDQVVAGGGDQGVVRRGAGGSAGAQPGGGEVHGVSVAKPSGDVRAHGARPVRSEGTRVAPASPVERDGQPLLLAGLVPEGDLQVDLLAVADDGHRHLGPGLQRPDAGDQGVRAVQARAVERDDRVTLLDAAVRRGLAADDRVDDRGLPGGVVHLDRAVLEADPEVGVLDGAGGEQLVGDAARLVGRDGEAEADVAGLTTQARAQRRDRRRDADHPPGGVDERAAAVAGVDGSVGLDGVGDRPSRPAPAGPGRTGPGPGPGSAAGW